MKIRTNEEITSFKGEALKSPDGEVLTVGMAMANILLAPRQSGYEMEKVKIYVLAQRFYTEEVVDIDKADIKKVKKMVETDKAYGPLVAGKILLILDEEEKDEEKDKK